MGKSKAEMLLKECSSRNILLAIEYQKTNGFSVEILNRSHEIMFYTDGHTKLKTAVKEAAKFVNSLH
jgi:hypothetical protein